MYFSEKVTCSLEAFWKIRKNRKKKIKITHNAQTPTPLALRTENKEGRDLAASDLEAPGGTLGQGPCPRRRPLPAEGGLGAQLGRPHFAWYGRHSVPTRDSWQTA